jgi:PAS domain S-box-containing protein
MLFNIGLYVAGSLYFEKGKEEQSLSQEFMNILATGTIPSRMPHRETLINLPDKKAAILKLLRQYFPHTKSQEILEQCLITLHLSDKEKISIVELIELSKEVEKYLTGSIGAAAAHHTILHSDIFTPVEETELSKVYAEIIADLKLSPSELKGKIDYYKEREQLLEKKYQTLVENVNIGIYRNTGGPYGQFLQANPAIARMFGYNSVDEFLKIQTSSLYQDPRDRLKFVEKIQIQGYVTDEQLKLLKKDGTPIWCSVTAKAQYDEYGEIKWIDGVIEDITERKLAEKALGESENLYRTIFETTGASTIIVQEDMTISMVNMEYEKLLGYSREEIVGRKKWDDFIAKDDLDRLREYHRLRRIDPDAVPRTYESKLIDKQGNIKKVSITANIIPGTTKSIISILDLTKHKLAEERLVQSLEVLQSVYNIVTTLRGSYEAAYDQVVYNLASLLKVSHVSVQQIDEDRIRIISSLTKGKFLHNETIPLEHSPCSLMCQKNETSQITGALDQLFPNNQFLSEHKFRTHIGVPIKNISGKVTGSLCVMDNEKRIFTEEETRLIEIFARYVSYELERNMLEIELRQLDKMKILGQMAAGVAHEVRNPLNAILAITEALFQDIGDNPEYKPFLDHIRTQVDRLSRLMGDLLALGKPIQPSNLHRESLSSLCYSVLDLWKQTPLSQTHSIQLVLPKQTDNLFIVADGSRIQQVFLNLLENAAQHSSEGTEIQFVVENPKSKHARICVIDQGLGIPPENLQKVFEPFFTTRKRGNGLGLSLVKNTIESHGGNIIIKNNIPPPGCTVEIILPLIQEEE